MKILVCYEDNANKDFHKTVRITVPPNWNQHYISDLTKHYVKTFNKVFLHKLDESDIHFAVYLNDNVTYVPVPANGIISSYTYDNIKLYARHNRPLNQDTKVDGATDLNHVYEVCDAGDTIKHVDNTPCSSTDYGINTTAVYEAHLMTDDVVVTEYTQAKDDRFIPRDVAISNTVSKNTDRDAKAASPIVATYQKSFFDDTRDDIMDFITPLTNIDTIVDCFISGLDWLGVHTTPLYQELEHEFSSPSPKYDDINLIVRQNFESLLKQNYTTSIMDDAIDCISTSINVVKTTTATPEPGRPPTTPTTAPPTTSPLAPLTTVTELFGSMESETGNNHNINDHNHDKDSAGQELEAAMDHQQISKTDYPSDDTSNSKATTIGHLNHHKEMGKRKDLRHSLSMIEQCVSE